jgi:hypothetical protein
MTAKGGGKIHRQRMRASMKVLTQPEEVTALPFGRRTSLGNRYPTTSTPHHLVRREQGKGAPASPINTWMENLTVPV